MLDKIISFSLKNKLPVIIGTIVLIVAGIFITKRMDIDVFPDLTAPTVVIMTDVTGLDSEEMERHITFQIETALNGARDVRRIRSTSMQGYSFVWVEFDWGTDIFKARQIVSEKLVSIAEVLPENATPTLAPQSSIMGEIMFVGLQSDSLSAMDLRMMADWIVKPAILSTGGVSQVTVMGGETKQYHILADPLKMNHYEVTMDEIEAVGKSFSNNSSGGVLRDFSNEYTVKGVARSNDISELKSSFVKMNNGKPVILSDVAELKIGAAKRTGYAYINAKPGIIISISKQPNVNTLELTKNIEERLKETKKTLPEHVELNSNIFRQADFIETSVNNIERALIEGAFFVTIILLMFLGSIRTTIISIVAIPLSLLGSIIILHILGMNINTMTLGGMCIAIGSLVDDAIIDVENVYKRLRENIKKPKKERDSSYNIVFRASKEIRASILHATFIIIVAFIPLFFLSGMEGLMLKPLGYAYIISLSMSLLVAMTVTPLMCKMMLSNPKYLMKRDKESFVARKLTSAYDTSLAWVLSHKRAVSIPILILFLISVVLFFTLGRGFLPEFNEGALTISASVKPGISLEENNKIGLLIEKELLSIPEITSSARRTGRGELDEHSQATNSAEIDLNFTLDKRSQSEFMADVRNRLSSIPGIVYAVGQPLGHRIDHMLSGTRAGIAIKLYGNDLTTLFTIGNRIKNEISVIDGVVDANIELQTETPQIQIRANREMLARYGITIEHFNEFIEQAFAEKVIGEIYEGQKNFEVILKLNDNYTESLEDMKATLIGTESGKKVPLEEVAQFVSTGSANSISRENVRRRIIVSANVSDRDMKSVVNDIKEKIDKNIVLPESYFVEYSGQFENAESASRTLFLASLLAIIIIFLLLHGEFKDFSLASIILLNLPLALIGGVFALFITGKDISIPSIIGFITLFGIATRNGILLISKYKHLKEENMPLHEAIRKGSVDRLNPILMTALTAALALIPLVINGDKPGNEIQSPMAIVVLGGLFTSTFLNIYVIPIVYELFETRKDKRRKAVLPIE